MSTAPLLDRFVQAQNPVYRTVRSELAAGHKQTHWIWFIFPQLRSLGRSDTALYFGLEDAAEASAYLSHPVLGPRLKECVELLLTVQGKSIHTILGHPDDLKLCSCMTLFEAIAPNPSLFAKVLNRYYGGERDPLTLAQLQSGD